MQLQSSSIIIQNSCKINIHAQRGDSIHQLLERRFHKFPSSFQHEVYIIIMNGNLEHNSSTQVILIIIHNIHLAFNNQLPTINNGKL